MSFFQNIDLFSVGIAIAATGILGAIVYLDNKKSITNRIFLIFCSVSITWGIVNFAHYQTHSLDKSLWLLRLVIFLGLWQAFSLFELFHVFPKEKIDFSEKHENFLVPLVIITAIVTLTPLGFSKVTGFTDSGVPLTEKGPGIILFGLVAIGLVVAGMFLLIRKTIRAQGQEKIQLRLISTGAFIMFVSIITFNFIFAAFFDNLRFIPLGAVFILPFVVFTAYAILKYHLLGVKVITTEILTFVLAMAVLYEVIFAEDLVTRILRFGIFLLVFAFSILLIRSVRKEVEQRQRLEILSQQKSEFLSFAAHQVKGPISSVKGFAELLADGTYGPLTPEAKEKAKRIKEIADQTVALAVNFLDANKIEEGKVMELKREPVDIGQLIAAMVEEYQVKAKSGQKDVAVEFAPPPAVITAQVDKEKMRQVLQNLIDNALKYTEHGYVRIELTTDNQQPTTPSGQPLVASGSVLITVADSGRGMSKELLGKLFGRYVRDVSTEKQVQGTGLGLYIAKGIVEAHGGSIWAESEGEGKGSRFFVRLGK